MASVTKPARTRDPDAKRAAVLSAARRVFVRQGYAAASMADVAREAGIAVGTIYRFFPAKIDLLRALHEALADAFIAAMRAAWADEGTYEARLRRLVRSLFGLIRERRDELRILAMTTDVGPGPVDRVRGCIAALAEEAMRDGAFRRMDPDHYAALVHGLVAGAMERHLRFGDDGTLEKTTEDMLCRAALRR